LVSARTVGALFVLEPVVAAVVGMIFMGQVLTVSVLVGMCLVILSGAAVVWGAGRKGAVAALATPRGRDLGAE
jgi:inner membrane transporter RhtA